MLLGTKTLKSFLLLFIWRSESRSKEMYRGVKKLKGTNPVMAINLKLEVKVKRILMNNWGLVLSLLELKPETIWTTWKLALLLPFQKVRWKGQRELRLVNPWLASRWLEIASLITSRSIISLMALSWPTKVSVSMVSQLPQVAPQWCKPHLQPRMKTSGHRPIIPTWSASIKT